MTRALPRRFELHAFATGAALIYVVSLAALASPAFARHPGPLALAVTLDLTLSAGVLAWLLLVRTGRAGGAILLAVVAVGAATATRVLPEAHRTLALPAVALCELCALGLAGWRARRVARHVRENPLGLPPEEALRHGLEEVLGRSRVTAALAAEAALVLMAVGSWRRGPHEPPDAVPFSTHRRAGLGAVVAGIGLAAVAETLGLHALLAHWSARAAWVATGLSAYALVWLLGDLRAVALRPVLLRTHALEVRIGLRWRVEVPLALIGRICPGPDPLRHRGALALSAMGEPNLYLHLDGPVAAEGLLGLHRTAACLGLRVDEPERLAAALRAAREA